MGAADGTPGASPLARMGAATGAEYWNDGCVRDELAYALARGAVGATSNPSLVLEALRKERSHWTGRIRALHEASPALPEDEITWALIEEMATGAAALLEQVFRDRDGRCGRLSLQTNPTFYGDADRIVAQAVRFAALAPNLQVKIPVTAAGITAIEEATFRGISINATVSFTVAQALAVGEAVERGLRRREAAGLETAALTPVCTLMFGRVDDWLRTIVERDQLSVHPGALDWAGIAVTKRAVQLYRERGYRTRMLGGAFRHLLHWTELMGPDLILTFPYAWQLRFNASGLDPVARLDEPVDPSFIDALSEQLPDFRRAYEPDGLSVAEFDGYGATVRTLRGFIGAYHDLVAAVRDVVLPNPDVRP
jgi:transaldolase